MPIDDKKIIALIKAKPGLTEKGISEALFGDHADPKRITDDIHILFKSGVISSTGKGKHDNPFKYRI
jgi:predicted HTH transcriptional regulator